MGPWEEPSGASQHSSCRRSGRGRKRLDGKEILMEVGRRSWGWGGKICQAKGKVGERRREKEREGERRREKEREGERRREKEREGERRREKEREGERRREAER